MTDAELWARSWFGGLICNDVPVPVTLQDRRSAAVEPSELLEALRELRRPVADGVPKHGRYAVVYEQPWGGVDAVWMEAAEYAYGMFGARFVLVQQIRRGTRGELVPVGGIVELEDGSPAAAPAREATSVREVVCSGMARARRAWAVRLRGARLQSPPIHSPGELVTRTLAAARRWPRRLAARPAAVVVALWSVLVLIGVGSAFALTTGDGALAGPSHSSGHAGRAAGSPPQAAPPASDASAPAKPVPARPDPVRGDLGVQVPISKPTCDGSYGVIIASVTRPESYQREVRDLLARYSGSSYLLTEQTCPSLRARTASGTSIYAVYYGPYDSLGNACATRARIGAGSYVRKLDNTDSYGRVVHC